MENLKIIALQAENIKKLVAVEIRPDGNLVQITGANGNGKTSILDAISWALEGQSVIQGEPIRKGQTKAWVKLDLGDMIVKRSFRKGDDGETTSSISVESKDGAKFPSPQAMIDKLIGRLAFDPLAFARMKPRDQFDELKRLVPGVDFDAIEKANKTNFERRTLLNRTAKEKRNLQAAIAASENGPVDRIDEAALIAKLDEAGKHNSDIERRKANREALQKEIKRDDDILATMTVKAVEEAQRIEAEAKVRAMKVIEDCQREAEALTISVADRHNKLANAPTLPDPIDTTTIRAEIDTARAENKTRIARELKISYRDEADKLEAQASGLTEAMEAREKDKREKIAAAKLPVEAMGFGEGIVTLGGVPFDQASDAEQLRASIGIAMSLNPKLRVIRVRDGSLLDENSLKLLAEMADAKDYQVWIERVDSSGKVGFVVEDGRIKSLVAA